MGIFKMDDDLDLDLSDILTEEEFEELRQRKYDAYYNAPLSSESLGLSDDDFFWNKKGEKCWKISHLMNNERCLTNTKDFLFGGEWKPHHSLEQNNTKNKHKGKKKWTCNQKISMN